MSKPARETWVDPAVDPLTRYAACKAMARGYAEARKTDKTRLSHARAFCAAVVVSYWATLCKRHKTDMKVRPMPLTAPALAIDVQRTAEDVGGLIAEFPAEDAGYLIGSIYTVMLPTALRSELGAYYTPPPLVTRLLDLAEQAGFDFTHGTVVDPACGGGAFLAPVALRMWQRDKGASPEWTFRRIAKRLRGIEIDPFAAWMTRVLLEAALMPLCIAAKRRLPDVVTVADALRPEDFGTFDLVIGNPPYGRVTLDEPMRNHYARSLYGHANLYGLFTDLALRLAKPDGVIAYLTPTSFLGGQYFKALRQLITDETKPVAFDFVADREGVFDDVLQETLLTAYTRKPHDAAPIVSVLVPKGLNAAKVERIGNVSLTTTGDPWLLPRTAADASFLTAIDGMTTRLSDLGYTVSTGPLVWNRHKAQLRVEAIDGALPLIWAESVTPNGFVFSADRRNHVPFIAVHHDQPHLIVRKSCVLVQRTTSKEQNRRLLAALLPQSYLDKTGGAVVENHLNMVVAPSLDLARVKPSTIEALLNTEAVDRAFRCISGSVAVSAYELNALPLPSIEQLIALEKLVGKRASKRDIERAVAGYYGIVKP
ncbi:HsdM family class I SAM-dependent methyltransferase [Burkholderia vietnamiensis]|uniref:HsdM family class I SAM-dependent methyltransferase n=1 Tax=Burkholderia vietnamiensis TaxID=60552 RepID=UPI001ABB9E78|nr:Eco57I restriction-modification methylase domain-containing protein [Burkholderia vietnamiensis]